MADAVEPGILKTFTELGGKFSLEPKVVTWLTSKQGLGARTLDDFLFSCDDAKDVKSLHAKPSQRMNTWQLVASAKHGMR